MVSYGILDAWWHLDSSCHKCPFCKIILNDVSVKFFTGSDQIAAMSCMRWTVLVACFQDSNKDGKKYLDQLSNFLVYGMLSFKSTPGFIKTMWFFLSWAERNPLKKQIFAVSSWCQIKKPDGLFCLGYWKTPSILTMLNVMGSSFPLFDVTVNISHGKFFSAKSSHMRHANFL